jgi:hypothetical protein
MSRYWMVGLQRRFPRWRVLGWVLVTAPLWIVGAFIVIRDGVLPPEYRDIYIWQFLPAFRPNWSVYVIGFLIYVIILILFVVPVANHATLAAERERANKKIRRYQRMREGQRRPEPDRRDLAESNIEPYSLETIPACRNEKGLLIETSADKAELRALVIPFRNNRHHRSLRRVGDVYDVSAQISCFSWDGGTFDLRPGPAAWLSEEREKIPFRRDDQPSRLVLATTGVSDYSTLCVAQRQTATLGSAVREIPLSGNYWRVSVVFHSESETKPIARYGFVLLRDGHAFWDYITSGTPHLETYSLWKSSRLTKHILTGYDLLKRIRVGEDVVEEHQAWETETAAFLKRNFDEKSRSKFLFEKHSTGRFARQPEMPATLESRIGKQLDTLDELSKKD